MTTQKFMGRNQLVDRLAAQVGNKDTAIAILKQRGQMDANGALTAAGQKRNMMTAEERAKDRAVKRTGHPAKDFTYSARTNRATLKGR
jgi:prolyl-tRNA editing enzyme YbaK/EbsC (Cys-tRNA(Pro) deacylase)